MLDKTKLDLEKIHEAFEELEVLHSTEENSSQSYIEIFDQTMEAKPGILLPKTENTDSRHYRLDQLNQEELEKITKQQNHIIGTIEYTFRDVDSEEITEIYVAGVIEYPGKFNTETDHSAEAYRTLKEKHPKKPIKFKPEPYFLENCEPDIEHNENSASLLESGLEKLKSYLTEENQEYILKDR